MGTWGVALSPNALKAVLLAMEATGALGHYSIRAEHILLGLVRETEGLAGQVLRSLGVDPEKVKNRVTFINGTGASSASKEIVWGQSAKGVLHLAVQEASKLGQAEVDSMDLLIAMFREEDVAAEILESLGVTLDAVHSRANQLLAAPQKGDAS